MALNNIRIAPEPLVTLQGGRCVYSVIEATEIVTGTGKGDFGAHPVISQVREGSLVLTGPDNNLLVGPIDPDRALDLAAAVCLSDPIALTGSQHIHILATALLGLAACFPANPEPVPPIAKSEVA